MMTAAIDALAWAVLVFATTSASLTVKASFQAASTMSWVRAMWPRYRNLIHGGRNLRLCITAPRLAILFLSAQV
ncbi:hypothetical protein PC129_g15153 [Phytophthora cactorum]|uniref:Secreted protein n=1 Tax=Phytophthora cactorum TaxID=29920 RepID=A0A8T1B8V5_9STRA|nr:hypothetical protein Pcac1_g9406 [Phytophthora cactorum]KAG2812595.1 hypothetical protein PC111_g14741 [Phytophthora cactorum]KAG2886226.1 hypothetical protein PC114_g19367 [Phytophthora cactorum]KAG2897857.1 hypothetical protein PC115_g17023 [Phytophthora cactorum]KAG2913922.1 hypothetical protein PC117_g18475 [Phytophthora cactorum]